jgi:hypothetical protein
VTSKITADRAREVFSYDAETGVITRKVDGLKSKKGDVVSGAGNSRGYKRASLDGERFYLHRLVWLLHYGHWPKQEIDHIDGDRSNNAIKNLRDVSHSVNMHNLKSPMSRNKAGYLGVSPASWCDRYQATIFVDGRHNHLGYFDDPKDAHKRYMEAKKELHAGFVA